MCLSHPSVHTIACSGNGNRSSIPPSPPPGLAGAATLPDETSQGANLAGVVAPAVVIPCIAALLILCACYLVHRYRARQAAKGEIPSMVINAAATLTATLSSPGDTINSTRSVQLSRKAKDGGDQSGTSATADNNSTYADTKSHSGDANGTGSVTTADVQLAIDSSLWDLGGDVFITKEQALQVGRSGVCV